MNFKKKLALLSLALSVGVYLQAYSQKIKYKDLVLLLSSKQYEKAEPFLKKYLKENSDNPNAYLYMAIVFQDKTMRMDPLLHTEILATNLDSALIFYDKAFKTITERELRKNDDYYEPYSRRDPRTGKFVIKLSDVQLFIDDQVKFCKEKMHRVRLLHNYFTASEKSYARANSIYKSLQSTYGSDKVLFLRSDEKLIDKLKHLELVFDSSTQAFDRYKTVSKQLGKTGHDQLLDLVEIKDFTRDGSSLADFLKDDLKVWDYKRWAAEATVKIEKEVKPLLANLVAYDIELNKLREKIKTDSISVKNDLTKLVNKLLEEQLKKYDTDPMPLAVFAMKTADLEYQSDVIIDKPIKDSANVRLRLNTIDKELKGLKKIDSLATLLAKRNLEDESQNYKNFISRAFGKVTVLQENIVAIKEYAERELIKKQKLWEINSQALKWLVNGADSIPLFTEQNLDLKYKPLVIENEKFTFGLVYQDSLAKGYFYKITPSRIAGYKVNFSVDQLSFIKRNFSIYKGLWTMSASADTHFLLYYSTLKIKEQFKSSLIKINRTDGLVWSNNFNLDFLPSEISFNNDTGEVLIKLLDADGSAKIMVVDKNGKATKN
ncbi:MAG: hypothetical protein OJF59_002877 [Cytophagales bacterium]|jgi:hypothetical protein|nr:hypothetical protein [Bacteroidota bacterium]MBS1981736.1 hypothetical protein [Bacteroidota bacterium]WHZ09121.1 MAG: hypothetical protein OJF59_002877 [Cytophagales bacterium]